MRHFFLLLLLAACSTGGHIMTMNAFYDIPIGASREEVLSQAGSPARVRRLENGCEEFDYVERMTAGAMLYTSGPRVLQERRYVITLRDGVVVSKRVEQSSPHPTQFDSLEMQTSQNAE